MRKLSIRLFNSEVQMLEPSSKLENSSWSQGHSLSVLSLHHLVTNTGQRCHRQGRVTAQPAWLLSSAAPRESPAGPAQLCV